MSNLCRDLFLFVALFDIYFSALSVGQTFLPRQKRSDPVVGGESEKDVNAPEYVKLAAEAKDKYLKDSNTEGEYKVSQIEKVTSQTVAGTLTNIDFFIVRENCDDCKPLSCQATIKEREWENFKEIEVICNPALSRRRRQLGALGAEKEVDPNSATYKDLAEDSLKKYAASSGTKQQLKVEKIKKVTEQVVAGTKYTIDFEILAVETKERYDCISTIFDQPWTNTKDIDVNCTPIVRR